MSSGNGWLAGLGTLVAVLVVGGIIALAGATFVRTDGGHIAVVRNGGPFDNNQIRDVVQPGSSRKYEGMFSQEHMYPASQRYYTITADGGGDRPGVDVFKGTTSDGVNGVGLEGTVQFTLDTNPATLKAFDNRFGTRTFPVAGTNDAMHPWDGEEGWSAFLDAVFRRQVLDNALRVELQQYRCVDLIPSCKYISNVGNAAVDGAKANANLTTIQKNIAQELQSDLDSTLRGHFLNISTFRITRVSLPAQVEQAIQAANAAKVEVQHQRYVAQQKVQQAIGDKEANIQKAQGIRALNAAYANSPAKAKIDAIAALPSGLQTLVIGGNGNTLIPTK